MQRTKRKIRMRDTVITHINNNIKDYLIVTIIFLIGLVIGVIFVNNSSEAEKGEISSYITNMVTELQNNSSIDKFGLLKESISQNILFGIFLWFVGLAVISIPIVYLTVAFRGFLLGYTISATVSILGIGRGIVFTLCTIFLQNILLIPSIFALAVSGIKLYKSIVKKENKTINVKTEILRHTIFSGIVILVLVLSSFVEVYLSSNILTWFIKYI